MCWTEAGKGWGSSSGPWALQGLTRENRVRILGGSPRAQVSLKKKKKNTPLLPASQELWSVTQCHFWFMDRSIWREPAGCLTKWLCFSAPKLKLPLGKWKSENFSNTEEKLRKGEKAQEEENKRLGSKVSFFFFFSKVSYRYKPTQLFLNLNGI